MADFPEIRIDVGIDDSSIDTSFDKIIGKTKLLEKSISDAMSELSKSDGGKKATKQFEESISEVTRLYNSLRKEMSEELSMSVGIDSLAIQDEFALVQSELRSQLANLEVTLQQSDFSDADLNLVGLENSISSMQEQLSSLDTDAFASAGSLEKLDEAFEDLNKSASGSFEDSLEGIADAEKEVTDNSDAMADAIKDASKGFEGADKEIDDTTESLDKFANGSDKVDRALDGMIQKLLLFVSFDKLKDIGESAIDLSSNLVEMKNVTDTVFRDSSAIVDEFAQTALESFGLAEASARQYVSGLGAIFGSAGLEDIIGTDAMAEMSVSLTKLTADLASFYNLSTEEVFTKLRSGLTGETEAVKALGIALYEADIQEYLLKQGIDETWTSLSNNEKILIRYNKILQDTTFLQGDFAKTSDTFANSVRVLQERWQNLLTLWGNYLIPVITPAINALNDLLQILTAVTGQLAQLFGWQDYQVITAQASSNVASVSDYLGASVDNADALASGVKSAGDEAKKSLAPFSELNILTSESASGGSGGGTSASIGDSTLDLANVYGGSDTLGYLDDLAKNLEQLEISKKAEKIVDFVTDVYNVMKKLSPLIKGGLAGLFSYSAMKKVVSVWDALGGSAEALKGIFSGDFTGSTATKMTKLAAAVGVAVVEFEAIQLIVDNFVLDKIDSETGDFAGTWEDVAAAVGLSVAVIGGASVALYALLGPIGLVVGALAGATAAVQAYNDYQQEVSDGLINANLGGDLPLVNALDSISKVSFGEVSTSLSILEDELGSLQGQQDALGNLVSEFETLEGIAETSPDSIGELTNQLTNVTNALVAQAEQVAFNNYMWGLNQIAISNLTEAEKELATESVEARFKSQTDAIAGLGDALRKAGEDGEYTAEEISGLSEKIQDVAGESGEATVEYGIEFDTSNIDYTDLEAIPGTIDALNQEISDLEARYLEDRQDYISQALESGLSEEVAAETFDTGAITEAYREGLDNTYEQMAEIYSNFQSEAAEIFPDLTLEDKNSVASALGGMTTIFEDLEGYYTEAGGYVSDLTVLGAETAEDLNNSTEAWIQAIDDWEGSAEGIWNTFWHPDNTEVLEEWRQLGIDNVNGYTEGILDEASQQAVIDASASMAQNAIDSTQATQDSNSPSEVTRALGHDFDDGYILGITENTPLVSEAVTLMVSAALLELGTAEETARTGGSDFVTAMAEGITSAQDEVVLALKGVLNELSSNIDTWLDNLGSALSNTALSLGTISDSTSMQTASQSIANYSVPKLANGGVIQPNNEFVAILGDQKSGVNIETPLSTMVDAFTNALNTEGGAGFTGDIVIPIYVDGDLTDERVISAQELERYRSNGR